MYNLPPEPRMYCCAAIRPASIVWAFSHPGCIAWRPKSPKTTVFPRLALPFIRPLWTFRCLTRLGIDAIGGFSVVHTLVNPDLNSDVTLRGHRFSEAIVDFRPQRAQWNRAGNLLLSSSHLSSAETSRHLYLDALRTSFHRFFDGSLHDPSKAGPFRNLLGQFLRNQLGKQLGATDLFNFQIDSSPNQILQLFLQDLDLLTFLTNDQAGSRDVQINLDLIARPLDFDTIDSCGFVVFRRMLLDEVPNLLVFNQQVRKLFLGSIPTAFPVSKNPGTVTNWINFLSHS